jgi:hypothetical protein
LASVIGPGHRAGIHRQKKKRWSERALSTFP